MSVPNVSTADVLFKRSDPAGESGGRRALPPSAIPSRDDWRVRLLERSSTLRERLGDDFEPIPGTEPDLQGVAQRLTRWRMLAAKGSEAQFARLLSARGLDPAVLEQRLRAVRWSARKPLPQWLATLEHVVEESQRPEALATTSAQDSPWAAFMLPFIAAFRTGLKRTCAHEGIAPIDAVRVAGERALARGLGRLFAAPLAAAYADFRARTDDNATVDDAVRDEFVQQLRAPTRLREFLVEYSVAARGAARLIEQSQHNLAEMLLRLEHDRGAIVQEFSPLGDPGDVVALDCSLSDPHRGGRAVMRLTLASGLRLIYKPRPVSLDLAYGALLNWLQARGLTHSLRTPKYLAREDHAWVEHIDHVACATRAELECFCRNAGVLLALAYLLDATDLHDGNLIAAGVSPVIIDLETLLQPRLCEPRTAHPQDALREVVRRIDHSVLRSGLLPSLKAGSDGSPADVGCLGSLFESRSAHWYARDAESSPLMPGTAQATDAVVLAGEIGRGFADTYRLLISQRAALADPCGPLQAFAHQRLRFVFRDTNLYLRLLEPSLAAAVLREGVDRSIELEALYRTVLIRDTTAALTAAVDAEVAALEALDIPLVGADADDDALVTQSGERIAGFFQQPSFKALHDRLDALSEKDLAAQLGLVALAFQTRAAAAEPSTAWVHLAAAERAPGLDPARATFDPERVAAQLLAELCAQRVIGEDGSTSWLAPVPVANGGHWSIGPLPLDLRSGNLGVALFAAASARQPGNEEGAAGLARSATMLVLRRLQLQPGTTSSYFARHGDDLYALARIAELLDDTALRAQTQTLVDAPTWLAEVAQAVSGRARDRCELTVGLLALGRNGDALQLASALHTQWQQASAAAQRALLRTAPRLPVCFARVGHEAGDDRLRRASLDALSMLGEAAHHDPVSLSALPAALLGCIGAIAADELREPLVRALAGFDAARPPLLDGIDAGVCGQIELLLSAGLALGDRQFGERARCLAADMVARATTRGGFNLVHGLPPGILLPGFDCGVAGIGYTLLRLQHGAALPGVLLRE